jgi:hypothetical protein
MEHGKDSHQEVRGTDLHDIRQRRGQVAGDGWLVEDVAAVTEVLGRGDRADAVITDRELCDLDGRPEPEDFMDTLETRLGGGIGDGPDGDALLDVPRPVGELHGAEEMRRSSRSPSKSPLIRRLAHDDLRMGNGAGRPVGTVHEFRHFPEGLSPSAPAALSQALIPQHMLSFEILRSWRLKP